MHRHIIYPGAIPLETDLLNTNKYTMIALAKMASAIMGTSTYVNGLACTPTSPASMNINIAAGEIYSLQNIDGTAYSSLAADTTHSILKQGYVLDAQSFTLTAPTTSGFSVNYLVQATYSDTDGGSTVLPYYNASNPSTAWSGPNNSGSSQYTVRQGICTVALKSGVAATTGTQTTPSVDTGYIGLYVITVAYGASTVTGANISTYANAPFLPASGLIDGIQRDTLKYGVDTGVANAYVVNINPGILSLSTGTEIKFQATNANTSSSTLNVSGTGAYPVLSKYGSTLIAGEIAAGSIVKVVWSASASSWFILDATKSIPTAPTATTGDNSTQIATTAFVQTANTGIVGAAVNAKMTIATASATGTFTADEIIVADSLAGRQFRLTAFSKTVNLAATGANGMDTGTAPTSGFVALYAIYNPTTATSALLAVNATAAAVAEIYGGANMPSGYTASALLCVVPTDSTGKIVPLLQMGRKTLIATAQLSSTTAFISTPTALNISATVPKNAKFLDGILYLVSGNSTRPVISVQPLATPAVGMKQLVGGNSTGVNNTQAPFSDLVISTAQTIYWQVYAGVAGDTISSAFTYATAYSI